MKFVFALFLVGVLAIVKAEECHNAGECVHVSCPENDYSLDCHNRQCTCTHTSATCSSQNDCNDGNCDRTQHCIDGRCRCGFGFGGIGR
ncbi:hypothetical protein ACF0H5_013914 [Mactra antiquata]